MSVFASRSAVRTAVLSTLVGLVLAAAAWFLVLPQLRPHVFHGTVIQSTTKAPDVDLIATSGERVSLDDYAGKLLVLYFGYTFCPDVCPTTLAKLDKALDRMGPDAAEVQVVMVSVDPARDTPELLEEYVGFFDPSFEGLTGTEAEIAAVATVYGVFFQAREGSAATGYLVDHTATLLVVDKDGFLKLVLSGEVTADEIAEDLGFLL